MANGWTIHISRKKCDKYNCKYPIQVNVKSQDHLNKALLYDHMCSEMKDNYRKDGNFISCDMIMIDIDNTHSDDPNNWVTKDEIIESIPVNCFFAHSRNYMKQKVKETEEGSIILEAREKWHIYFPLKNIITTAEDFDVMMNHLIGLFPYIDLSAKDNTRFFYASDNPSVEAESAGIYLDDYIDGFDPAELKELERNNITNFIHKVENGVYESVKNINEYRKLISDNTDNSNTYINSNVPGNNKDYSAQLKSKKFLFEFVEKHGIHLGKEEVCTIKNAYINDNHVYRYAVECPWHDEHTEDTGEKQSVILIYSNGMIGYDCKHNHCKGREWRDFRSFYEPDYKPNNIVEWNNKDLGKQPGHWRPPNIVYNEKMKILQTINNAVEIIQYEPYLYNRIKYNSLAYSLYAFGSLPWNKCADIREWTNHDDANLKLYLESKYDVRPNDNKYQTAISVIESRTKYNPLIDLLEQCHKQWDGESHIENLLNSFLGVEKNDYTTEVMTLFMLGAISRAYHPGCKFDYVPVLYGEQGCGKSTFCRMLSMNDEWFDDNFNTIEGDKAAEKIRGLWIAELAEMLATKRAKEVEGIKAFISSRSDNYRPPWGKRTEHRDRVCVFIGTTNNSCFLIDESGNRRFLPLIANVNNASYPIIYNGNDIKADLEIKQAWGEAMDLFIKCNKKPRLVLSVESEQIAKTMQQQFSEEIPEVGMIQNYLDTICRDNRVCAVQLWQEALKNNSTPRKADCSRINNIMRNKIEGWREVTPRNCGVYGKQRAFERI